MLLSAKNKNLIFINLDTEKVEKIEFQIKYNVKNYILKNMYEILDDGMISVLCWLENMCISQIFKETQKNEVIGKLIIHQIL